MCTTTSLLTTLALSSILLLPFVTGQNLPILQIKPPSIPLRPHPLFPTLNPSTHIPLLPPPTRILNETRPGLASRSLVEVDLVGIYLIGDERGPVLVAPSEDVFDEGDGLVGFSYDGEDTVASGHFVVLQGEEEMVQ